MAPFTWVHKLFGTYHRIETRTIIIWKNGENMTEKQLAIESGNLFYRIEQEKAIVTGYRGFAPNLSLPPRIEGYPVTVIDRKALLSQKSLCSLRLPDTIQEVGDWAFAYCDSLVEISFPKQEVRFGRAVFKDCGSLQRISVRMPDQVSCRQVPAGDNLSCPELLAAAVTMLEAPYLLDIPRAGTPEWLEQWDIRLLSVLRAQDSEGYISQSVYGEEDYIGTDLEEFTSAKRENKVRLSFLRLLHPQRLKPALQEELEQYLRSLTKGRPTEEAWQVLRREHAAHGDYYSLFARLGCITDENFQGILADIGEDSPEMKAFFLKYREERRGEIGDFFESLEL